jgi:hypothetical protein
MQGQSRHVVIDFRGHVDNQRQLPLLEAVASFAFGLLAMPTGDAEITLQAGHGVLLHLICVSELTEDGAQIWAFSVK